MFHKGVVINLILSIGEQFRSSASVFKRLLLDSSSNLLFTNGSGAGLATYRRKLIIFKIYYLIHITLFNNIIMYNFEQRNCSNERIKNTCAVSLLFFHEIPFIVLIAR